MIRDLVVELVSPAMVGGAVPRECDDPPRLRPPSVRGQLRFWTHALGGADLVQRLWGTEAVGQRVRILGCRSDTRDGNLPTARRALLIPSRDTQAPMVPPGSFVLIRFAVSDEDLLEPLQAVAWTWLHLGAVGRRSRRGYGSLLWIPSEDDLLAEWPPLWRSQHLAERSKLESYLSTGLSRVESLLGSPGNGSRQATPDRLTTRDQVFVGKELLGQWNVEQGDRQLEIALHGRNEGARGGELEQKQLGSAKPRLPSPMLWRVFPTGAGCLPVMTWFPCGYESGATPQVDRDSQLYEYLHETLGLDTSLTTGELGA